MSERAHVIEIDRIVLRGVDRRDPGLGGLVEAEVRRVLQGTGSHALTDCGMGETRVAGKVAQTVVRAFGRGTDAV